MSRELLICILSPSGGGKSTLVQELERKYGYTTVKSYTTRAIRENDPEDIRTHTFISLDDVDKYKDEIVADNWFNGNYYFATKSQCDNADIYILDKQGLINLYNNYHGKNIIAIYLDVDSSILASRMERRGDSNEAIMSRLQHDSEAFRGTKNLCDFICENNTQAQQNDICEFINMLFKYRKVNND